MNINPVRNKKSEISADLSKTNRISNGVNPSIFKAYDVRGIYPDEINEEAAYLISKALVKFLKVKSVVLGRDMRPSSAPLYSAVLKGLKEMGVKIYDIGLATTPMYMYVINLEKADAGIVVTASHNPAKYNGLRMESKFGASVGEGSGMEKIRDMVLGGKAAKIKPVFKKYKIVKKNYLKKYVDFLAKRFSPKDFSGLKVAIDAGNGMTGIVLPPLLKKLKIKYYPIYFKLDGTFPYHDANPVEEKNLKDLVKLLRRKKAFLGLAFDGDGDRVGFVDNKGQPVDMDYISALLTIDALKKNPGAKIVYDNSSSRIVREIIEENGGRALICRTGHSFFRRLIRKEKALFGCEKSGHCMWKEFFFVEAAILTMLYVLKLLKQSDRNINELINPFKKYFFSLEAIDFPQRGNFKKIVKKLEAKYKDAKLSHLDGLSVEYPDWWFNIRLSNTEPIIRLRIEAINPALLKEKKKEILKTI